MAGVRKAEVNNGGRAVRLTVQGNMGAVLQAAAQHGATDLVTREPTLEEIFLRYYTPQATAVAGGH